MCFCFPRERAVAALVPPQLFSIALFRARDADPLGLAYPEAVFPELAGPSLDPRLAGNLELLALLALPREANKLHYSNYLAQSLGKFRSIVFQDVSGARPKLFTFAVLVACTLVIGLNASHAGLQLQAGIDGWCQPAKPTGYTILRWKPQQACNSDCFVWRVTCSDGSTHDLQAKFHPATTDWQMVFYAWAPWSFIVYLLPFVAFAGLAAVGARHVVAQTLLNGFLVAYAAYAAARLYVSITDDPFDAGVMTTVFLNPYVYAAVLATFVAINVRPVLRGLADLFHRPSDMPTESMWSNHPMDAAAMAAALMPQLHEFASARETAAYYQRQADEARALKEKFDAERKLAEAIIRQARLRRNNDDQC